jgi:secreted trypsin-like serine protease
MRRIALFLLLLFLPSFIAIPAANSIEVPGGKLAIGTNRVLTLAVGLYSRNPHCSMAMITDQIVVTAAHCVAKDNTDDGTLRWPLESVYVTQPGIDIRSDNVTTRVKVAKVFFPVKYEAFFNSSIGDLRGAQNDVAFLFLEKALVPGYNIPVASQQEVESIQTSGFPVDHFGYGLQNQYGSDGKPYSLTSLTRPRKYGFENDPTQLISGDYGLPSVCGGDSGGPVYGTFNGIYKLIAVANGGGGCFPNLGPTSGAYSRPIYPYLDLALTEWKKVEVELKAQQEAKQEVKQESARKMTITCTKGKTVKKVTGIKPVCPKGYKKK